MLKCCARTPAASTITPQSLWNTGKWNTANCFCLLIVFLSIPIFCLFLFFVFSYFLSFPFFPSPCEIRGSETLQTVFVFSLSFCLFVFSYFVSPSPVNHQWKVKHCKRNFVFSFLSWCLFVSSLFCLLFQVQVQPQWNTANSIRTDIWGFFVICQIKKKVLKCQSSGPLNCQKERKNHFSIITKLLCGLIGKKKWKKRNIPSLSECFAQVNKITDKMWIIMRCNDLQKFLRVFMIHESWILFEVDRVGQLARWIDRLYPVIASLGRLLHNCFF